LGEFGFDGRRWRGSGGNPLGEAFLAALTWKRDGTVTRQVFVRRFATWFEKWDRDETGVLTEEQLRDGIAKELSTLRGDSGGFHSGAPGNR